MIFEKGYGGVGILKNMVLIWWKMKKVRLHNDNQHIKVRFAIHEF